MQEVAAGALLLSSAAIREKGPETLDPFSILLYNVR